MRQPLPVDGTQLLAIGGDQFRRKFQGTRYGNLLAEHGANGDFEAVPRARHAQARTPGDQRRKQRVLSKVLADGQRVRAEVENVSNAPNNRGKRCDARKADRHAQAALPLVRFNSDRPLRTV